MGIRSRMQMKALRTVMTAVVAASVAAAIALPAARSQAQPVADFYRGKTLRILVGYGPGGGYDIYGRLVAEFLPRHLPGNPTIIPQNMPGAGSFVAAKIYLRCRAQGRHRLRQPRPDAPARQHVESGR